MPRCSTTPWKTPTPLHGELEEHFGAAVAGLVAEVTDDTSLASDVRKARQISEAPHKSHKAKLIRLADKACNVRDITRNPPPNWSLERRRTYFSWADKVVKALGPVNPELEKAFAEAVEEARKSVF